MAHPSATSKSHLSPFLSPQPTKSTKNPTHSDKILLNLRQIFIQTQIMNTALHEYNLGFISNENIFNHVKQTVELYRTAIDLCEFNKNIVDPIKLTFDAKIYGKSIESLIEDECFRQIDKTNSNHIGYFHQNLFQYAGHGWEVPANGVTGFDVQNPTQHIYAELKNKHNTMNSAVAKNTYIKMQNLILGDDQAVCMLVETIAKKSQNCKWKIKINDRDYAHERIHRVSMDKFYGLVFADETAFARLCTMLPQILDDVLQTIEITNGDNSVFKELRNISPDVLKSLYLLAFKTYDGFENF